MNREARRKAGLVDVGGVLVERDALHIAERVHEYDSNLHVQYLEQSDSLAEPPFRIVEKCRDGLERVVFTFWELNGQVLERLYAADTHIQDIDAIVTGKNVEARCNMKQRFQERLDASHELAASVLKSQKTSYSANVLQNDGTTKKVVFE